MVISAVIGVHSVDDTNTNVADHNKDSVDTFVLVGQDSVDTFVFVGEDSASHICKPEHQEGDLVKEHEGYLAIVADVVGEDSGVGCSFDGCFLSSFSSFFVLVSTAWSPLSNVEHLVKPNQAYANLITITQSYY